MVRSIYQQPCAQEVHIQHEKVVEQLAERFPQAAAIRLVGSVLAEQND